MNLVLSRSENQRGDGDRHGSSHAQRSMGTIWSGYRAEALLTASPRMGVLWLLLVLAPGAAIGPGRAADELPASAEDQTSIDDAGRALGRTWRYRWYNAAQDRVRPVAIEEDEPPANLPLLRILAWMAIAVVLTAVAWLIVTTLRSFAGAGPIASPTKRAARKVDHVEALPFLARRSLDDLLGQARQHWQAGNFDEAIIYLFSYQLVELDRRNFIRLWPGKTNRQYLRELRGTPRLAGLAASGGLLHETMVAFEDVYFGDRPLGRERFEACWNRLPQFEALVAEPAGVAAQAAPVELAIAAALEHSPLRIE